jgi:hypothetical protein
VRVAGEEVIGDGLFDGGKDLAIDVVEEVDEKQKRQRDSTRGE